MVFYEELDLGCADPTLILSQALYQRIEIMKKDYQVWIFPNCCVN